MLNNGSRFRVFVWTGGNDSNTLRVDAYLFIYLFFENEDEISVLDQFRYVGNRARYEFFELDMSTGLDEQIDLGKPYSICRYRARFVEDGE